MIALQIFVASLKSTAKFCEFFFYIKFNNSRTSETHLADFKTRLLHFVANDPIRNSISERKNLALLPCIEKTFDLRMDSFSCSSCS